MHIQGCVRGLIIHQDPPTSMTQDPPDEWLRLDDLQRDILTSLDVDGPASGNELRDRVGLGGERAVKSTVHRHIGRLREKGLVESYPDRGPSATSRITDRGRRVLAGAREWMQA